ncbi:carbonic anhydrase [Salinirubrum litoreum]|uniref:carbonic anhydrase n=1 Tax=Salinirubrum litoreum TaxID=1126234 RepID=A0ABD5R846_9EURY|nr:carbonic anhydrase [Salinirubrum litoreum]
MHETFTRLLAGNDAHADEFRSKFDDLQDAQFPDAVTVCCADSRVLQDRMWGNDDPGHLFTCGNIGNRVVQEVGGEQVVSGDVLYPVEHTGTETVVVVGHTGCGAVTATYADLTDGIDEPAGIRRCLDLLAPHVGPGVEALPDDLSDAEAVNYLVEYNVDRQVAFLCDSDEVPDSVTIYGVVYDFQDVYSERRGEVQVINVDGERDPETLREEHPGFADRVRRLWTY